MSTLRGAVARQIAALGNKIAAWEQSGASDLREGVALMKAQALNAHDALKADDPLALLTIKEEIERDHKNLSDFA